MMVTAHSLLKSKMMPGQMWGEAVRHAIYILNRAPTKAVVGRTPYEAWSGKKPQIEHLRVFGCVGHVKVPSVQLKKLDDRSMPMVYLGSEEGSKAYRMYDPQSKKLHISRDVFFEEEKAWEWGETANQDPQAWVTFTVDDCAGYSDGDMIVAGDEPELDSCVP